VLQPQICVPVFKANETGTLKKKSKLGNQDYIVII
jgi:hypothetical protein